jgi:two-component system sensor kinase FixL
VSQPTAGEFRFYGVAVLLVAASLLTRWILSGWFAGNVPYLQFFPAILVAAWYGGLGPGILATVLSALAAMYFFLPPAGLAVGDAPDAMSLGLFVVIGLGIAWLNHQRRNAAIVSASRAERLDAIINTTVDGIIVISAEGKIEAFNRGAERLFGYPESEVLGRNVSLLMPSPNHEEHDGYSEAVPDHR